MISYPLAVGGIASRVLQSGLSGRAVIFIHGTGGRADRWMRNLDAIAERGYRAFAIDLPGHGFAAKGGELDHSVPAYAQFVSNFIAQSDLDEVTLVGTSLGGHVAATCAANAPDRVRSIVLVGSMGLVPIGEEARGRIQRGASNQTREGVAMKLRRVIFDAAIVTPAFEEEEFRVNNSPGAQESFDRLGHYIGERGDIDVVGDRVVEMSATKPVLLVWGDKDQTVPLEVGRRVREQLPKAQLVVIPDASHTAYFEKPEIFNHALVQFLEEGRVASVGEGVQLI